ncbi:MAG: hypothetical protein K1X88_35125 [Nannocystaceae bacterium]|nr:hypothetical protein [Nannocystaceae bacterium]
MLAALTPQVARADAIDALAPGTWLELPDTAMRTVCPPDSPQYEWSFYCQNVILAWGGAALDTTRGRMVLFGGGHGDYRGNEVYVFDLQSLQWSRIWGPTPDDQIPSGGTHEVYDDGNPGSRHTYSGLTYLPPPHDALVSMGGALWQSGGFAVGTWSFSFDANGWSRRADGPAEQGFGDPSVFDPLTGHVFRRANSGMLEYDPATDAFTSRAPSDGGWWAANVAAALDPDARLMVIIGEGRLDTYDLAADVYTVDVPIAGTDVTTLFGGGSPGIDFDPVQQRFIVWGGGLDVYTFDPAAATFSLLEGAGDDPGTITASGGAFGRFRYAPSRNVFVWIDHVDANVFVYRSSEGTGTPPPGDDTTGGGGEGSSGSADADTGAGADSSGPPPATTGDAEAGSGETGGGSGSGSGGAAIDPAAGGCGCRHGGGAAPWAWLWVAAIARRRGRGVSRTARRDVRGRDATSHDAP